MIQHLLKKSKLNLKKKFEGEKIDLELENMKSNEIKNKMSKLKTCLEVANDNLNDVRKLEIKDDEHKFTDSLRHTIIHLVLESQVSIMGHSMGGHGALTLALKNPVRLK